VETIIAERIQHTSSRFRPQVYWYLSLRCNLACKHCWVNSSPTVDTSTDLTTEEILAAMERLKEVDPSLVIFTGGEPLMRRDARQILRAVVNQRIPFSVETNGILLREEYIDLFRDALDRGVYCWISVSLDGGTAAAHEWIRGRGSFALTMRGLRRLKAAAIPFGVQCVVNKKNLSTIPNLFEIATDLEFNTEENLLAFVVVNPIGRGELAADELSIDYEEYQRAFQLIADGLERFAGGVLIKVPPAAIPIRYLQRFMTDPKVKFLTSCSFPLLGVLPDGTLSVCALTGRDGTLELGHISRDSLVDVVRRRVEPLRQDYDRAHLTGICADCMFKHSCKGSCRAFAYSQFGSFIGAHPLCDALEKQGLFPDLYRISYHQRLRAGTPSGAGNLSVRASTSASA